MTTTLLGGLEAGGTKMVCAVGTGPGDLWARERIPTGTPEETLPRLAAWFAEQGERHGGLAALGIASFGPLELRPGSPRYGHIAATPKEGWSRVDLVGPFRGLGVPIGFDTDVNGAALGEQRWGAARGLETFAYLTLGTGVGGGGMARGRLLHGLVHPEMGHLPVPRHPDDDFPGTCRYHGDCLEGMACGPAIEARWGRSPEDLGDLVEPAVALEAHYLAMGLRAVTYLLAPERIVVGGGVAKLPGLLPAVRARLREEIAGYPGLEAHGAGIGGFVVPAALGDDAGVAGALALADAARDGS